MIAEDQIILLNGLIDFLETRNNIDKEMALKLKEEVEKAKLQDSSYIALIETLLKNQTLETIAAVLNEWKRLGAYPNNVHKVRFKVLINQLIVKGVFDKDIGSNLIQKLESRARDECFLDTPFIGDIMQKLNSPEGIASALNIWKQLGASHNDILCALNYVRVSPYPHLTLPVEDISTILTQYQRISSPTAKEFSSILLRLKSRGMTDMYFSHILNQLILQNTPANYIGFILVEIIMDQLSLERTKNILQGLKDLNIPHNVIRAIIGNIITYQKAITLSKGPHSIDVALFIVSVLLLIFLILFI